MFSCLLMWTCIYCNYFRASSSIEEKSGKKSESYEADAHVWVLPDVWPMRRSPAACPWWLEKARPSTSSFPSHSPDRIETGEKNQTVHLCIRTLGQSQDRALDKPEPEQLQNWIWAATNLSLCQFAAAPGQGKALPWTFKFLKWRKWIER